MARYFSDIKKKKKRKPLKGVCLFIISNISCVNQQFISQLS